MGTKTIKFQIKKIANEFNLKYNSKWFAYLWISVRMEILTEYIGFCPDPIYEKYGKTPAERIRNIKEFETSKDFKKCLKRYGGQAVSKKDLSKEKSLILQIKDEKYEWKFDKKMEQHLSWDN